MSMLSYGMEEKEHYFVGIKLLTENSILNVVHTFNINFVFKLCAGLQSVNGKYSDIEILSLDILY